MPEAREEGKWGKQDAIDKYVYCVIYCHAAISRFFDPLLATSHSQKRLTNRPFLAVTVSVQRLVVLYGQRVQPTHPTWERRLDYG